MKNNRAQDEALAKANFQKEFAFFMEPGMGKTRTAIKEAEQMYQQGLIDRVLVFAPGGVIRNWSSLEIPKHLDPRYHSETYVFQWEGAGTKTEKQNVKDFVTDTKGLRIFCMNIEAISASTYGEVIARAFLSRGKSLLIIDEATTIGNCSSKRSKAVHAMLHLTQYRRVLTGTPFCGGPDKVHSILLGLSPIVLGRKDIYTFRARYALMKKMKIPGKEGEKKERKINLVIGFLNEKELREKMDQKAFFASKKDYLDLPDKIRVTRSVELTLEQCRIINDIREKWLAELGPEEYVSIKNALGLRLRILQVYAGHVQDTVSGNIVDVKSNRITQLQEQLEEYGPGCVIWATFKRAHEHMSQVLGPRAGFFNGQTPNQERSRIVEKFQNGDLDYFVGSMAGGFGLTLTRATSEIYYTQVPSVLDRIQTGDRTHRIGQTNSVVSCDLIVSRGLDAKIRKKHLEGVDFSGEMMRKDVLDDYLFST